MARKRVWFCFWCIEHIHIGCRHPLFAPRRLTLGIIMLALKGFGFVVQLMVQLESVSGLVRDTIIPLAAEYLPCFKPRGDVRFAKAVWQVMERVSQRCLVALALIFVGTWECFALARHVELSCGSGISARLCSAGMLEGQAPCLPPASCMCNVASAACGHDEPATFVCVS